MLQRMAWSCVPSPSFSAARLGEVIALARISNHRNHVSGRLLFTGAHILEIVEGEARDLDELWSRVNSDTRHEDVIRLGDEPCGERWYPEWMIGYADDTQVCDDMEALRSAHPGHDSAWANTTRSIMRRADSM
ncbi:hypothetical protein BURK1_02077 [Burkholderiales bacterium]|nr:hypothetical protein BURK1_02077 [Burkholderiales bacterium]